MKTNLRMQKMSVSQCLILRKQLKQVKNCVDALVWPLWILYEKTREQKIPDSLKYSRVLSSI